MSTKLYDPSQVAITWGPNLLSGFADGTFIKITRAEDSFFTHVGTDGEVSRSRNKNKSGEVEITLKQTSASNDILSAAQQLDETTGAGVMPLMVKDLLGTTLRMSPNAWVKKVADQEFAKENSDRVWVLSCDQITGNVGGSNPGP